MAELTKKQQYWKAHLDALASFDGSTVDYARQHDLDPKKLYVFKSVLREKEVESSTEPTFVRASVASAASSRSEANVAVMLPNGVRLNLPQLDSTILNHLAAL